jgi:acyl transferase domain-containing protein/acyl carrier protein
MLQHGTHEKRVRTPARTLSTEWKHEGVAIVGIGCRFPGAASPQEFWQLLKDGHDLIQEIPVERFDLTAYYDPDPVTPGRTHSRWGGFITDLTKFDAAFFGISPREAKAMDPQQRLLLEAGWDALTDAGIRPSALAGTRTGVFVGLVATNYWELQARSQRTIYSVIGSARAVLSGRLSYALDLRGPSVSIDTACSSSLVAAHAGYRSIRNGESDMALIAGVNVVLSLDESIAYSSAGMLSSDGRCKFGDVSGDGFVRSDGVGVVVLKPLARATADGDRIYAVIRGSAINSDGRGSGYLMMPAEAGQINLLRQALADAGVHPRDLAYVEAHGTGTQVGDAVELRALEKVLRRHRTPERPCLVGSVKTNIGHTEGAAGVAGLIKVALSLYHGRIPASLHAKTLNPAIKWETSPLVVCQDSVEWSRYKDREAVAGVSSFGISGSNAHIVLARTPKTSARAARAKSKNAASDQATQPYRGDAAGNLLLPLSAATPQALHSLAEAYAGQLERTGRTAAARTCAAAARRRDHYPYRLAVTASSGPELAATLRTAVAGTSPGPGSGAAPPGIIFVFPGQGGQWPAMGRELFHAESAFRASLEQCDAAIAQEVNWSIIDVLMEGNDDTWLQHADAIQPVLWAVQVSLATLWRSWGVRPRCVVGHSMGEVAAAHVAGALSIQDAARIICRRSRLARSVNGNGAMAVVNLSDSALAERIAAHYSGQLFVAAHNSPCQSIVSGDAAAIRALLAELDSDGVSGRPIRVEYASHSPQVDVLREKLLRELADLSPRKTNVPFYSTVRSTELCGPELDAAYWADNLREPVRFAEAITALSAAGRTIFLEISPHPVLVGPVNECLDAAQRKGVVLHSMLREEVELGTLYAQAAELYREGVNLDWEGIYPGTALHADLPRYPWQHEHFWIEEEQEAAWPPVKRPDGNGQNPRPGHPLLTVRQDHAGFSRWEAAPAPQAIRYLSDHRVQGTAVVPATLYLELAHAAVRDIGGATGTVELRNVRIPVGLFLDQSTRPVFRIELRPTQNHMTWQFEVQAADAARGAQDWTVHATGTAVAMAEVQSDNVADVADAYQRCGNRLSATEFYQTAERNGNQWYGVFQGVREIWCGHREVLARIDAVSDTCEQAGYAFHPALLDACGHVLAALRNQANASSANTGTQQGPFLGDSFDGIRFYRTPGRQLLSHATLQPSGPDTLRGDISIRTPAGELVAEIVGMTVRFFDSQTPVSPAGNFPPPASAPDATAPGSPADWLHTVEWRVIGPPATQPAHLERWLLYSADRDQAARVLPFLPGEAVFEGIESLATDGHTDEECMARLLAADSRLHGETPLGVVYLPPVATGSRRQDDDSGAQACHQLTRLLRVLTAIRLRHGARLWLVTRGTQPATPEDTVPHPAMAVLWGMGRVAALEVPELACTLIDLPASPGIHEPAELARELCAGLEETQVALRDGRRLVPRLTATTLPHYAQRSVPSRLVRKDVGYLVTGGLGDLGRVTIDWLIRRGARHILIVGRSPHPSLSDLAETGQVLACRTAIETWQAQGATVIYRQADVADESAISTALREWAREGQPAIRGVFHIAGIASEQLLIDLESPDLDALLRPKLYGGSVLHRTIGQEELDFFVLYSSGASVLSSPMVGGYAAASAALDALAAHRRAQGMPATSIGWGFWNRIGMSARQEIRIGRSRIPAGMRGFSPEQGIRALGLLLEADEYKDIMVLPANWQKWAEAHSEAARSPILRELVPDSARHPSAVSERISKLQAQPSASPNGMTLGDIVQELAAKVLHLPLHRIARNQPLNQLGLDSLMATELRNLLRRELGAQVPMISLLRGASVDDMVNVITASLPHVSRPATSADTF